MLLASCATPQIQELEPVVIEEEQAEPTPQPQPQPEPEPVPEPEPEPIPEPEPEPEVVWTIGEAGPNGGLVFQCDGVYLEIGEPMYETPSYEDALSWCQELTESSGITYRLPTLSELDAIYNQLVLTELAELDWTYYWSCEETEDGSVMILNFDTGFEGKFYKDMDFLSAIPVTEL